MDIKKGFTIVEFLAALLITSTIIAYGIPAFSDLSYRTHRTAAINHFVSMLIYTRSEALKRNSIVIFCLSSSDEACMTGSSTLWQQGIVFPDSNQDGVKDSSESLLKVFDPDNNVNIYASSIYRRKIKFYPDGSTPVSNTTVLFCDPARKGDPKAVIISTTGRPRISDSDASGSKLVCPDS